MAPKLPYLLVVMLRALDLTATLSQRAAKRISVRHGVLVLIAVPRQLGVQTSSTASVPGLDYTLDSDLPTESGIRSPNFRPLQPSPTTFPSHVKCRFPGHFCPCH